MGETRTTARKKRAITEGGFRIWQLMDMLRNVTGSNIMCVAYPEQTSQITVSDLARSHLIDTVEVFIVVNCRNEFCDHPIPKKVSGGVDNDCELELRLTLSRDIQLPINKDMEEYSKGGGILHKWMMDEEL